MSNKLLYDEAPLCVSPTLATIFGLNESIVIQQIHYFLEINRKSGHNYVDGRYWTYNSYADWKRECFPFWSDSTIKRTFKSLERDGLLITGHHSNNSRDQRKWYTIDYEKYAERIDEYQKWQMDLPKDDVAEQDTMVKLTTPYGQNDLMYNIYNIYSNSTKTSTKNSLNVLNGTSCDKHNDVRCSNNPFDPMILKRQVIGCCHNIGIMDDTEIDTLYKVVGYYYAKYRSTFMEEHPRLSTYAMKRVIDELRDKLTVYEPDELCELIDQHFDTIYGGMGTDYNICHFCSGEIIQNRSYEVFGV